MLKSACIHPELMGLLASCGHGDQILIGDGSYPIESKTGDAAVVYLNLTHGIPLVTDVLKVLESTIAIEKAEVMVPDEGPEPAIFAEFRSILGGNMPLDTLSRFDFYDACKKPDVKIAIATGEQRIFANILLTVGVV